MVRVLYGDVLLLIDFCMNFFVLYTSSLVLRRRVKAVCIAGASAIGGVYSVAKVFVSGNDVVDCIISLLVGLLMCYICFGLYSFLKTAVVFFGIASLVGGIMIATYFFLGSYHKDIYGNLYDYTYSHVPLWLFTVLAAVSMLISWIFTYIGRERTDKQEETATLVFGKKSLAVKLLLDSGNLIKEPISGKYVVLLGRGKAKTLLGEELFKAITEKNTELLLANNFRIVCVKGIDGEKRMYYGFLPDGFYIEKGNCRLELDAYVAVCDTAVLFDKCDGLAHPSAVL